MTFSDPNIIEAESAEIKSGGSHVPGVAILVAIPADLAAKAKRCGLAADKHVVGHEILLTRRELIQLIAECDPDPDEEHDA